MGQADMTARMFPLAVAIGTTVPLQIIHHPQRAVELGQSQMIQSKDTGHTAHARLPIPRPSSSLNEASSFLGCFAPQRAGLDTFLSRSHNLDRGPQRQPLPLTNRPA